MSNDFKPTDDPALDPDTCEQLGNELAAVQMPAHANARLRARLLENLDQLSAEAPAESGFITTFADENDGWESLSPLLERKLLHAEHQGARSYLLRAQPGAVAPAHRHNSDEICVVLEGEILINGMTLRSGDYHFAPKDTDHSEITSDTGALVYIRDA